MSAKGRAADLRTPAFTAEAEVAGGGGGKRLMFCFRTAGCVYAREVAPCTGCAFPYGSTWGVAVPEADLIEQFDSVVAGVDFAARGIVELDVYNQGSFFNDREIPPPVRDHLYRTASAAPGLEELLVESRAEDLDPEKLARMRAGVPAKRLTVGIGLESANARIRETLLGKGLTLEGFETALDRLAGHDIGVLAYMLFKPAGVGEAEAIADAEKTAAWLFEAARRRGMRAVASLQPAFVQKGTELWRLHRQGLWRPPWLWSVVEAVRRMAVHGGPISVGTSQDDPPPTAWRGNCGRCDARFEAALDAFQRSSDPGDLDGLDCPCRAEWEAALLEPAGAVPSGVEPEPEPV